MPVPGEHGASLAELGVVRLESLEAGLAEAESRCVAMRSHSEIATLWAWVAEAMRYFEAIDKDQSGEIDSEELMMDLLNRNKDVPTIRELFTCMDKDSSGSIDKVEWLAGYHEYARLAE